MSRWQLFHRRMGRRRFLKYAAMGAGAVTLAAACREEAAAPQATPPPAAAPGRGQGGVLVINDNGDPPSFDSTKTWGYRTHMPMSMVYPRLVKWGNGPNVGPLDYPVVPYLAAAMPEQPDATTYIFKLRPAKWENKPPLNGRPLTAEDIVKNWQRFSTEHPARLLFEDVDRVEAVAPDTARFIMRRPLGPLLAHLANHGTMYIMPYELFGTGQLEKDMWSAGPYIFKGYTVGSEERFEYNPDFFLEGFPRLSGVTIRIVPDTPTTISMLRTKQIDSTGWLANVVSPRDLSSLKGDLPNANFVRYYLSANFWLGLDLRDPVFQDKRVRQAISMAINRDDLNKVHVEGEWSLPHGYIPTFHFDPRKNEFPNARYYQFNPQEARALLRAAGHERLGPYDMYSGRIYWPEQLENAQLIQQQLRAVGIETNIKELPFAEYYSLGVVAGRWPSGMFHGNNLVGSDPNEHLTQFWLPNSPRLISPGLAPFLQQDTELLNAIERQKRELDLNRRRELIRQVVDIMAERMYNIPLVVPALYHMHQDYVREMYWISTAAPGSDWLLEPFKVSS
ncbi:Periplasmic dipeptide transport protein [bacterium HR24]|nr:Periplasmic dipeptide transport protein [bacterium HR24]